MLPIIFCVYIKYWFFITVTEIQFQRESISHGFTPNQSCPTCYVGCVMAKGNGIALSLLLTSVGGQVSTGTGNWLNLSNFISTFVGKTCPTLSLDSQRELRGKKIHEHFLLCLKLPAKKISPQLWMQNHYPYKKINGTKWLTHLILMEKFNSCLIWWSARKET